MSEHQHEEVDYTGFRIASLWAFTQVGPDDQEGIIAGYNSETEMLVPLIASDPVRLEDWMVLAQEAANETGREVKLAKFNVRVELDILTPSGPLVT